MTTFQTKKDPLLRGVSPTPSKIPVRSKRRPPLPTREPCDLDRENQDPKRLEQKFSTQRPLVDSAGHRPKATHQTQKSERSVGSTLLRKPLEELRPSPKEQSVGPGPPPQKEIPGVIEFVADPEALATILSGEGVQSCRLGRQPSLAQRVLVRESQGGTIRRGQGTRASAYLAPRTPQNRLDPARASCFSRLEGPGPRSWTSCPQKLEAVIPPSGPSFHSSARPSFQELKRETGGSSRTAVSQASGLHLETPVQRASSVLEGEHEVVTHSDEGGRGPPGLAQWVPLRDSRGLTHTKDSRDGHLMPSPGPGLLPSIPRPSPFGLASPSYSVLRRLAIRPKTQFTPIPSAPKAQQGQIAVRLFDQESCRRLQEGSGKPPVAAPHGPHPSRTPNLQELKMQRISILKQLLQQEVDGLAGSKCAPPNGGSSLDMVELQSLLAEIPRTLNAQSRILGLSAFLNCYSTLDCQSPAFQRSVGNHSCALEQSLRQLSPALWQSQGPQSPAIGGSLRYQSLPPRSSLRAWIRSGLPPEADWTSRALPSVEPEASEVCSLEPRSTGLVHSPAVWAPATTSVIFSSQRPLCASPTIHSLQSLRPPTGQAGPSSLAPRTLALRQRLKACLTAIHCSHEVRLDDECAFYTAEPLPPPLSCLHQSGGQVIGLAGCPVFYSNWFCRPSGLSDMRHPLPPVPALS
ncbi:LOW QUALITY PROTEIN: hypothetical protein QTO34_017595 [Cnephaeus nilssonii]|uniref:Tastin n=1 Tax=Cnephaeus nilssonii TaxID=3371016 RepID=A0AA40LRC7_CNENI|nr:LOW QUALITY PROTEIN: hypothetical protein QTO34_017595 [Eptesicus nilssonii]